MLPALPGLSDSPTDVEQAAYDLALLRQSAAEDLAVAVLWALSGRQFGVCPVVVRPDPVSGRVVEVAVADGGEWVPGLPSGRSSTHFGHGVPDGGVVGARAGDFYVDLDTGIVYELGGG